MVEAPIIPIIILLVPTAWSVDVPRDPHRYRVVDSVVDDGGSCCVNFNFSSSKKNFKRKATQLAISKLNYDYEAEGSVED